MKLSLHWLSKFVDLKGITPEDIRAKLTLHTAEVDSMEHLKPFFENVFAGQLLSVKPHPQSDKLSVAQFDLGKRGKKQIIFGQVHVLHVGEIYPVALAGCILKSGAEIKDAEIRGVKSEGMIADNQELGMKNAGLIRWKDKKIIGKSLLEIEEDFADVIFEIDNKSLTHRPDLWGHAGFARELSSIFHRKLNTKIFGKNTELLLPKVILPKTEKVKVKVETPNCLRWCSLCLSGVTIEPSNLSTQILLENLGIRSISNFVDITNLILAGIGQPMHVFDAKKLEGNLVVRQARKGEKLLALDGNEYELTPEETVVADEKKVLSLAGIMGGEFSGVTESTTDIIFEVANWNPVAVRKSSVRLGLRSDSSIRYEKSLDSDMCENAILGAVKQALIVCPKAKTTSSLTDAYAKKLPPLRVSLRSDRFRTHSGIAISDAEIKNALTSIGFGVTGTSGKLEVAIPSWRATKDVSIAEDLIEEVVRLYGFDNIDEVLPTLPIAPPRVNWMRRLEWECRDALSARRMQEVFNYSFVSAEDKKFTEMDGYVTIGNPLSDEQTHLRRTLISCIVRPMESELRTHGSLDFFELGKTYEEMPEEVLPNERLHLALLTAEISPEGEKDNAKFFELKRNLQGMFAAMYIVCDFRPSEIPTPYAHPSKSADIVVNGEIIGHIAVLHPNKNPVANASIAFAEIDMGSLLTHTRKSHISYTKLSPFPVVRRDISLVVNRKTLMSELEREALHSSRNLHKMELFDVFEDHKKLGADRKNLAFHLEFSCLDHMLTEKEIEQAFSDITRNLEKKFGAVLRGQFDSVAG